MRARILVLADWYRPGRKAGGLVTALHNLLLLLKDDFDFYMFTRDRDQEDREPYAGVPVDRWIRYDDINVYYTCDLSSRNILRRAREVAPNIIYLNSFFSTFTIRTLWLRRLGRLPQCPVILAPHGEFSPGALRLKRIRKWIFQKTAVVAGLYRDLIWQAGSPLEEEDIWQAGVIRSRRDSGRILLSHDVPEPDLLSLPEARGRIQKTPGRVRFIFISGILRKKNLHFALDLLATLSGNVHLSIVGPPHDAKYWTECQAQIRKLPPHINTEYHGPIPHERVRDMFLQHHFLLLPTLGENFGYVILEAMATGCPVVISDRTPWRTLNEKNAGWDLPLQDRLEWLRVMQGCIDMNGETYNRKAEASRGIVEEWSRSTPYRQQARDLFETALLAAGGAARDLSSSKT